MPGLGTIINCAAIIVGGIGGLTFGRFMKEGIQQGLVVACGVSVLFIGIAGALEGMMTVDRNVLVSGKGLLLIACIALGALVGELIDIEGGFEKFGNWLKRKSGSNDDNMFVDGFVTASFTVCIGAMAIIGAIKDGIYGDYSILISKSILDGVILIVLTASMGKGCIFSVIPVAILQGVVTLFARLIEPVLTQSALANLSLVGSVLIFCVGINLVFGKKVRVANLLPALLFAVAIAYLPFEL